MFYMFEITKDYFDNNNNDNLDFPNFFINFFNNYYQENYSVIASNKLAQYMNIDHIPSDVDDYIVDISKTSHKIYQQGKFYNSEESIEATLAAGAYSYLEGIGSTIQYYSKLQLKRTGYTYFTQSEIDEIFDPTS